MRVVSWNCNGALRNKTEKLNTLNADVLIIQECEDPSKSTLSYKNWASNYLWTGQSKNKGIGVFAKDNLNLIFLNWNKQYKIGIKNKSPATFWATRDLKLFLPFQVKNYLIIGVWNKASKEEVFGYIGQTWKFLQIHKKDLIGKNTMIIGDFNSNAAWDKPDRWWNHSDVVAELKELNIKSLYHTHFQEAQGRESLPTFYLYRKEKKPYHIDYAFCYSEILKRSTIQIGDKSDWLKLSDHMPLIVDIV